jgi:hypothetical protein
MDMQKRFEVVNSVPVNLKGGFVMWITLLGLVLFVLLALPVFPVPRVRYIALGVLHRLTQLLVLTAVAACAVFFLFPNLVSAWLSAILQPVLARLEQIIPEGRPEWIWLPIAAMIVAVSVPVLSMMDFARRLTSLTSLVRRLLGDIRDTAREMAASVVNGEAGHKTAVGGRAGDLKAAVESMERLLKEESHALPQRRRLIDLVSQ